MRTLKVGDHGVDVGGAQYLLLGHNRYKIQTYHGEISRRFDAATAKATRAMKYQIGYAKEDLNEFFGPTLYGYLITGGPDKKLRSPAMIARAKYRAYLARKKKYYPLLKKGTIIGLPGQGTHSWIVPPNNWESDNAVDIAIPVGTPVIACLDGQIGAQIGPLPSDDPHMEGQRLHLHTADGNEYYYAHLSKIFVHAGQNVKAGMQLGLSGRANTVAHLHWACRKGNPVDFLKGL